MRYIHGIVAGVLWCGLLSFFKSSGAAIPDDIAFISFSIIVAGGLAGGSD